MPYPDRLWLVFCTRLPWAACSWMLCFSSSRWPLVVSRGTAGALPGPLSLRAPAGTDLMVLVDGFVIVRLRHSPKPTQHARGAFPRTLSSRPLQASDVPEGECFWPRSRHGFACGATADAVALL